MARLPFEAPSEDHLPRMTVMAFGPAGSGKTTLLDLLAQHYDLMQLPPDRLDPGEEAAWIYQRMAAAPAPAPEPTPEPATSPLRVRPGPLAIAQLGKPLLFSVEGASCFTCPGCGGPVSWSRQDMGMPVRIRCGNGRCTWEVTVECALPTGTMAGTVLEINGDWPPRPQASRPLVDRHLLHVHGTYLHYKGGRYLLLGVGALESNPEAAMVFYRSEQDGHFWARPLQGADGWAHPVRWPDGIVRPRFALAADPPGGT